MGKKIKPGLYIDADVSEAMGAVGYIKGVSRTMSTPYFIEDVVELSHDRMAQRFDEHVAGTALQKAHALHHVYEPKMVGNPMGQLWSHRLYGKGGDRQASFEWIPSRLPILSPKERAKDASDPMSVIPKKVLGKLNKHGPYVFMWRAPMMEYGIRARIKPVNTKKLFIPTFKVNAERVRSGRKSGKNNEYKMRNYRFEMRNVPQFEYTNPQEPSGAVGTVGKFTGIWMEFWLEGRADEAFNDEVLPIITKDIKDIDRQLMRVKKRRSTAKMGIFTFASAEAAFESGEKMATGIVMGKARSYSSMAKYVDVHGIDRGPQMGWVI